MKRKGRVALPLARARTKARGLVNANYEGRTEPEQIGHAWDQRFISSRSQSSK